MTITAEKFLGNAKDETRKQLTEIASSPHILYFQVKVSRSGMSARIKMYVIQAQQYGPLRLVEVRPGDPGIPSNYPGSFDAERQVCKDVRSDARYNADDGWLVAGCGFNRCRELVEQIASWCGLDAETAKRLCAMKMEYL